MCYRDPYEYSMPDHAEDYTPQFDADSGSASAPEPAEATTA